VDGGVGPRNKRRLGVIICIASLEQQKKTNLAPVCIIQLLAGSVRYVWHPLLLFVHSLVGCMIVAFLSNDCVQSFIRVGIVDSLLRSAAVQPPSFFLNLILVFPPHVFIMAVNVMAPDMRYLLEEKGVDDELINSLTASDITTISRLSLLEDTRAGTRKVIEQTFKLDPDVGNNRMRQVCLLDA
jgi:hypothetical protein